MKHFGRSLIVLLVLIGVAAVYFWNKGRQPESRPQSAPPVPIRTETSAPAKQHYPVPALSPEPSAGSPGSGQQTRSLPAIEESDPTLLEGLERLFGKDRLAKLFNSTDIVRRVVVTVENITSNKQPSDDMLPLKSPESEFLAQGKGEALAIAPANFRRYDPYVDALRTVDAKKLIDVYVRFYPLFQSAYDDFGTSGYFNDRLVEVIDSLLATPEAVGAVKLTRVTAHSRYKFADDRFESLSAGQKLLIRMGDENARIVRAKLTEIRELLVHLSK